METIFNQKAGSEPLVRWTVGCVHGQLSINLLALSLPVGEGLSIYRSLQGEAGRVDPELLCGVLGSGGDLRWGCFWLQRGSVA